MSLKISLPVTPLISSGSDGKGAAVGLDSVSKEVADNAEDVARVTSVNR